MSDTRERARELAEDLTDSLYCGAGDEWKHRLDADKIQAALESGAALARKQERLECAKAVCKSCADNVPLRHMSWHWTHEIPGIGIGPCHAAAIHERNLAETGG